VDPSAFIGHTTAYSAPNQLPLLHLPAIDTMKNAVGEPQIGHNTA
jgi:hypothetical protein